MPKRKPEDIIALVDGHYEATEPLRDRMEEDHALYRLTPYDAGEGYQSYTSNEPRRTTPLRLRADPVSLAINRFRHT